MDMVQVLLSHLLDVQGLQEIRETEDHDCPDSLWETWIEKASKWRDMIQMS